MSCNLVTVDEELTVYPTKIAPLDVNALQKKDQDYKTLNNNRICSTLNEYGFTGFSRVLFPNGQNPCLSRDIIRIEMGRADTLINYASSTVRKNGLYTGVTDSSNLVVKEFAPLYGCTICEGPDINNEIIEWKITFEEQQADGILVSGTEITVFIDAFGVNRIWGNWYNGFYNPDRPNVSFEEARLLLIGLQLNFQSDNLNVNFEIQDDFMSTSETIEIRSYLNEGNLEIRKGYVIIIHNPELQDQNWEAFIDVMDGKVLSLSQL